MSFPQEHQARKRFGQNFLVDDNVITRIVQAIAPARGDNLVEIGPGQGAITGLLLEHCPTLNVVELDRDLIPRLQASFASYPDLHIHAAMRSTTSFCSMKCMSLISARYCKR